MTIFLARTICVLAALTVSGSVATVQPLATACGQRTGSGSGRVRLLPAGGAEANRSDSHVTANGFEMSPEPP